MPISTIDGARYYAYSITGPAPAEDRDWHAFDGDKVLLDPYAKVVFFPDDFSRDAAVQPGSNAGTRNSSGLRRSN